MSKLPVIKKKVSAFLTREDGRISKDKLLKTGIILSAIAIGTLKTVKADCPINTNNDHTDHCNGLRISYDNTVSSSAPGGTVTGTHNHAHGSHGSHSSHGSHGSHGHCNPF